MWRWEGKPAAGHACKCFRHPRSILFLSLTNRGRKKHINFFNINFLAPTQNPPFWAPRKKKFMCLISWERTQKRHISINLFGAIWGSKRGVPNGPFSATKSLVYCFFPALNKYPPPPAQNQYMQDNFSWGINLCVLFFLLFSPSPPSPSFLNPPPLPRTSKLLRFLEEMQYSGAGVRRGFWRGSPHRKKKEFP